MPWKLISLENGKQIWVGFKYERLLNLCYWCSRLTHNDKDCEMWIETEGTLTPEEKAIWSGIESTGLRHDKKDRVNSTRIL